MWSSGGLRPPRRNRSSAARTKHLRELERAIRGYVSITNEAPTPFIWTKTADQILASVARYCERDL